MSDPASPSGTIDPATMAQLSDAMWTDRYWWSADGLRLHYRDYAGPQDAASRPPVICIPGLTRNARDYDDLAPHLARHHRVLCVNLRGRGDSAYAKDPLTYTPLTYVQDLMALLTDQGIDRFISVGTSLGGLVTMILGAFHPGKIAAAVLNDVGPEIAPEGIARIRGYVGQGSSFPTWIHAARAVGELGADVYPDWRIEDWLKMVKRSHRLTAEGRIVTDYDSHIADVFKTPGGETTAGLWPALAAFKTVPLLLIRGAKSDILARSTVDRMQTELPHMQVVEIAGIGHAPTLDEPASRSAIDALLGGLPN